MADDKRSARELVQELRGRGISTKEIAGELGRDPRMVRKVLNGETSGAAYRATLIEIATTGQAKTRPARRRAKDGHIVPVRAAKGSETKTIVPADTGGRYTDKKQGGRFTSTTYLGGGGRQHEIHVPKGKTAKGRDAANADLTSKIRAAAKGQSGDNQKRVKMTLTYANGRVMEVNDYNASTLLQRINSNGGDVLGWLASQSDKRYKNLDLSKQTITGVTMTAYDTPKTNQYRANRGKK
jgi:DNA-binding transcriptional regulator YdaS (Cro superfamily)